MPWTLLLAAVATVLGLAALGLAAVALQRTKQLPPQRWRQLEGEARSMIVELDSLTEKMLTRLARESKRRSRAAIEEREEREEQEPEAPPEGGDYKAQLWALVRQNQQQLGPRRTG